ncbi:MAG TPA: 2-oxoglutarate dehydrogenase complex dihydrolipoyllysine-residue succinyltransferase [Hyphomicrobiaceae bacterium]|nr:2-oxoglutarate dehydrogenase complex dihydrolipoyllysine-residue succinyltransferase [Hyphomicrobiaceae bacterium]
MTIEIKVPTLGESVTEATVGQWFKKPGDAIKVDEPLVELETDKVTVEVPAPVAGVLADITVAQGTTVNIGAVLGFIKEGAAAAAAAPAATPAKIAEAPAPKSAAPASPVLPAAQHSGNGGMPPSPAARRVLEESGIAAADVAGSGRRGQVLKEDATAAAAAKAAAPARSAQASAPSAVMTTMPVPATQMRAPSPPNDAAREERVHMTRLRQTIARRLKDAQNTAAMLTTFNDVDMGAVMNLRSQYKDLFEKRHGVRLGFMGFFVKACIQALREIPAVNAEIDGEDIIYKNYYHIGVAVSTERGLVVPVIREADHLSFAEIEARIADFGKRARDGKLSIEEMQGGTFSITNGGVFGSLLSTPILNAPQSGILGMHRIEERAVVRKGQIVARPMMSLALSYDHRIVDGREAVTFLVRVKECLEDPQRFVLDL